MQTGSLINVIHDRTRDATPEVGMGVTFLYWTDRGAGTIVEVLNERTIVVKGDTAIRIDKGGMTDAQDYRYEHATSPGSSTFTLRKNGRWVKRGQDQKNGQRIAVGYRDAYYDYSF
jgi:hypothetical protein